MEGFNPSGQAAIGGLKIVNCTPHSVRFLHEPTGEEVIIPPCGLTLLADGQRRVVIDDALCSVVKTEYVPSETGEEELAWLSRNTDGVIVGSIVSAQAWPGVVYSLVVVGGQERLPPAERQYSATTFNTF